MVDRAEQTVGTDARLGPRPVAETWLPSMPARAADAEFAPPEGPPLMGPRCPSAFDVARQTLLILLPELLILLAAIAMMTAGAVRPLAAPRLVRRSRPSALRRGAAGACSRVRQPGDRPLLGGRAQRRLLVLRRGSSCCSPGLILLALAHDQVDDARAAEFFGSLLMINAGAMLVAAANELVFLFVGLELVSIPTYLLLYLSRRNASTQEAATKYFFLSIFSSGLLLYGLAFLYGLTGVSNLKAPGLPGRARVPSVPQPQLALIAVVFVMAGLGFRVAAVPFHFYAPDVYQGSPTVIAALLSWIPKAVGFLAIIRTLTAVVAAAGGSTPLGRQGGGPGLDHRGDHDDPGQHRRAAPGEPQAAAGLLVDRARRLPDDRRDGRLRTPPARARRRLPRLEGILFYLVAYALMTLGAFGVIIALSTPERPVETVDDLAGLGRTHPATALAMALCLFSLAGIPPLAGFWGKFQIFASALARPPDESTRDCSSGSR